MFEVIGYVARDPELIPNGWSLFLDYIVRDGLGITCAVRACSEPNYSDISEIMDDPNYRVLRQPRAIDPSRHALVERTDGTISIASRLLTGNQRINVDEVLGFKRAA